MGVFIPGGNTCPFLPKPQGDMDNLHTPFLSPQQDTKVVILLEVETELRRNRVMKGIIQFHGIAVTATDTSFRFSLIFSHLFSHFMSRVAPQGRLER